LVDHSPFCWDLVRPDYGWSVPLQPVPSDLGSSSA
jgi:hypothetical protein